MTGGLIHGVGDALLCAILIVGIAHSVRYVLKAVAWTCRTIQAWYVAINPGKVKELQEKVFVQEGEIIALRCRNRWLKAKIDADAKHR